jgi:two-component system, response regulator PdtaR
MVENPTQTCIAGVDTERVKMSGRILVLDDDRLVLATVSHGLQQAGFDVIDADNGDDAILLARQHRPELALLDIRMEGKTGFDVAAYLRDGPRIPFMFLSAFSDQKTLEQARELGAVDYLVKPLDVADLVPRVSEVLLRIREGLATPGVPVPTSPGAAPSPAAAAASPADGRAQASPPATTPMGTAKVAAVTADGLGDPLPLALGILMHRHTLSRQQALQRLQRMAAEQNLALGAQAARLVGAVEELARSGD